MSGYTGTQHHYITILGLVDSLKDTVITDIRYSNIDSSLLLFSERSRSMRLYFRQAADEIFRAIPGFIDQMLEADTFRGRVLHQCVRPAVGRSEAGARPKRLH